MNERFMPQTLLQTAKPAPLAHQWKPGKSANPEKVWKPGQSGNPSGKGSTFVEAQSIARKASPDAARCMVELMSDPDPRVRGYAADKIREWAWGKIPDYDPSKEERGDLPLDPSVLTPDQRQRFMQLLRLLMSAAEAGPAQTVDGLNDGTNAAASETVIETNELDGK